MMPLKAAALLWASVVLLMAMSSTCNGLSIRTLQQAYSSTASSPRTVDLKSASKFTVLAYSTVTNTGPTTVGGYIGVSSGRAITGIDNISYSDLPKPNGRASTETAATAKADLSEAYLDARDRTFNAVTIDVVNIGGLTFTPGLYKTEGSLAVSSGTVYLSGNGNFIFQIAKELKVSTNLKMVLQNGARASNVFWQVGSAATFEVGSEVVGTVMTGTAITAKTRAMITGRLLAVDAAVTMDRNNVVFPCSIVEGNLCSSA